ncbi:c-type cytochrome [Aureimonas leprariae]|uniref:C-type cytochrome n=1 Tax=Plantimonas leprariae TaxID=2615207 RepID=A0A7V7PLX9_9HYPH|nr:c-type cytochrome [Aureimonas leprariae]
MLAAAAPLTRVREAPAALGRDEPITPVPAVPGGDDPRVALGEALFRSPILSHGQDRSCASCHDLSTNGASAAVRDRRPDGGLLERNTNTVFNAALSARLNWLGNIERLDAHAESVLLRPDLMVSNWPEILTRLNGDALLRRSFARAFGREADRDGVIEAIAAYERTLLTPNSRFDLWLQGESGALSGGELDGYRLFKAIGCVSCHQGVNIGANLFARNGVFARLQADETRLMRVPSLRNVAATPPYFHDGSAATLEEAVQRMAKVQLGRELTTPQIGAITAFLRTLTGRFRGVPVRAPAPP